MKKIHLFFIVGILLLPISRFIQAQSGSFGSSDEDDAHRIHTGARKMSETEYLKIEQAKMLRSFADGSGALYKSLPPVVDLAKEFPGVGDQGTQGSCSGWAVGYAVKSFQENREHGWGFKKNHIFSPAFLYNQVNEGYDGGAYMLDVMKVIKEDGIVPMTMMPYKEKDFTSQPTAEMKAFARNFKALDFRRLVDADVNVIKAYLAAGDPVIFEMEIYPNFFSRGMRKNKNMYGWAEGESQGYHFLVAVGYDDSKRAFKLMNSWGRDWGDNGYGWMTYDFFPKAVPRSYVVYDLPTPPPAVAYVDSPTGTAPTGIKVTPAPQNESPPLPDANEELVMDVTPSVQTLPPPSITTAAVDPNAPQGEPLVIVPEEAGVTINKEWLRLNEPITRVADFFSEKNSARFKGFNPQGDDVRVTGGVLGDEQIAKIHFLAANRVPVATNLGVTFKTPKAEVQRIYRSPDHVDASSGSESYFYHAMGSNWGGVKVTQHATLTFHYDKADLVDYITLETVFRQAFTGQGFTAAAAQEMTKGTEGTVVDSSEGAIRFTVPADFPEVKKSSWPGTGVGYFSGNPANPVDYITVKVFQMAPGSTASVLEERITADLKSQRVPDAKPARDVTIGGAVWQLVSDGNGSHLRYYTFHGGRIYQIYVFSGPNAEVLPWVQAFLGSVAFK